ncbi:alpha/beta hydrolase [Nakamurella alba]|nr:alpha/beta hydrolase [Nakamurella alba]
MHARTRRTRTLRRLGLAGLAVLLVGCGSSVAGTPTVGAARATGSTTATTAPPGITVPSGGPGGSGASQPPTTDSGGSSQTSQSAGIGPVPDGLESFYTQQLSWGPCADYATTAADQQYYASDLVECARLTVPLAYDDPTGQTITIGVLRQQATGTDRIGSLLFNPGGPGASGMSLVSQIAVAGLAAPLSQRFDLVGFDPRGIGSSEPVITCRTDAEWDQFRAQDLRSDTAAAVTASNDRLQKVANDCAARTGKDEGIDGTTFLANVGTRDAARDMDVLRAALGDPKLNYVGYSYGTLLGTVYAEQFPGSVRAMILDGAVDPTQDPATGLLDQGKGFQDAFDDYAQWCAQQSACPLGTDPAKATAAYQELTRPLLDDPAQLPDGRVLSYSDANTATSQAMYSDALRPQLSQALTALAGGDGSQMMVLADQYYQRGSDGHYASLLDAFNAIRCMDGPRMTDDAEVTKLNAQYAQVAPFQDSGDPPGAVKDYCAFWPAEPTLSPHKPDVAGMDATILVVSTTGDPATPYQAGVDLAQDLGGALLTIDGTRHTGYLLSGISCADDIGNAYLLDLTVPADGATCS